MSINLARLNPRAHISAAKMIDTKTAIFHASTALISLVPNFITLVFGMVELNGCT